MRKHQYAKVCTVALASAGLLWAFKAAGIMITDDQPPLALELGGVLFPVGITGLYIAVDASRRLEKIGLMLAALSLIGLVLAILYSLIPGAQISSAEEFIFPISLFILMGSASVGDHLNSPLNRENDHLNSPPRDHLNSPVR